MKARSRAFTLVELLVVISIVALLVSISLGSLPGLGRSNDMNRAASGIPLLLEEARAYAMAHNTYVWVGFLEEAQSHQLLVGMAAGKNGLSSDLDAGSLVPISKLATYDRLSLGEVSGLPDMAANADDLADSQIGSFVQALGTKSFTFARVLRYSPQGEATIKADGGGSHWIQIGLLPVQGAKDRNVVAIQIGTLTGQVETFRR
ncbi:MAG TPA: prepilin-type N-terminal cleavage/methylation domain-containing protein [Candidatus Methylacidiphilales bacterium]